MRLPFDFNFTFLSNGSPAEILSGGKIDRIDSVGGVARIVDYKTGNISDSVSSVSDLFKEDRKKDSDGWLQTLLYCEAYLAVNKGITVRPSVYKIKKLSDSQVTDKLILKTGKGQDIKIENYESVREEFLIGLKGLIETIFSESEPFIKTTDIRGKCSYCPYKILCMR